jgi:hypothetical protein
VGRRPEAAPGGRKLAGEANGRPLAESLRDALATFGFVPHAEPTPAGELRFVLRARSVCRGL